MPSPLRKGIEFRGVCFCYPGMDDVPVLRDLSFVEEVQLRIVQQVRQLEEQGQVTILRGEADDTFV